MEIVVITRYLYRKSKRQVLRWQADDSKVYQHSALGYQCPSVFVETLA